MLWITDNLQATKYIKKSRSNLNFPREYLSSIKKISHTITSYKVFIELQTSNIMKFFLEIFPLLYILLRVLMKFSCYTKKKKHLWNINKNIKNKMKYKIVFEILNFMQYFFFNSFGIN